MERSKTRMGGRLSGRTLQASLSNESMRGATMSHIGIITAWNYAWSVLTACFVLGVAIFLLDRKFGIKIYRFLYDFFHKDPMPSDVDRGFLYNQSTNRGVTGAVFLSTDR